MRAYGIRPFEPGDQVIVRIKGEIARGIVQTCRISTHEQYKKLKQVYAFRTLGIGEPVYDVKGEDWEQSFSHFKLLELTTDRKPQQPTRTAETTKSFIKPRLMSRHF